MPTLLPARSPHRPQRTRRLFVAGRVGPGVRTSVTWPGAHRLQLLVCAAALVPLVPAGLQAQQPAPSDTTPARTRPDTSRVPLPPLPDSSPAPRADSTRTAAPGDSARSLPPVTDSGRGLPPASDTLARSAGVADTARNRIAVPGDTACVGQGFPVEVVCRARAVMADSARLRALAAIAAEKILKHAAREDRLRQAPVTWAEYKHSAFGSETVLRVAAIAAWDQMLGRGGWGRDGLGYALRFTTRLGSEAAAGYVRFQVASHVRVREAPYVPCGCQGTGPRLLHALTAPFRTRALDGGERFSPLTPVTELGGGMLLATVGTGGVRPRQGMVAGLNGLLSLSLVATLREFRPWELWKAPAH